MDSLTGFTVFVAVAEARSFVAAGRALGVSASAVGKSIARLEDKLGVRLFHRSTRSITLTAEGGLFLERSRRILAEIEAAEQELSQAAGAPHGRLRVSLPLVSTLVLPVLSDFMRLHPAVQLDLDFTDRMVDVIDEGFDAVVRTGQPTDSRLSARQVGTFRQMLVASPAYLAQRGVPQASADLLLHSCLHFRFPHNGKLDTWPLPGEDDQPPWSPPISMVCNNIETRVCFAVQGRGIAFLPDFSIRDQLADGRLVQVLPGCERSSAFHVLWPASRHPSPKVRALVDFLCEHLFAAPSPTTKQEHGKR